MGSERQLKAFRKVVKVCVKEMLFRGTGEIDMECQGKMLRAVTRNAESTDVRVCGGLPRSSVEVSVMGRERRG